MRRLILFITLLVLVFFCFAAAGAEGSWVCPECGKEGNTENFCVNCAHPSPTPAPAQKSVTYYTITWQDETGKTISTESAAYGTKPSHADPKKEPDQQYTYTFSGWEPAIKNVTGNATYKATFRRELRYYTITWQDDTGNRIDTTSVAYGFKPSHTVLTKEADKQYTYTFNGWKPNIEKVTDDATYKATFKKEVRQYTVTWQDDTGKTIDTTSVLYGFMPSHLKPTKEADKKYTYTFTGWQPEIKKVTGDATYKATFKKEPVVTPTPKPKVALKISKVKYLGGGQVQIDWKGTDSAVKIYAYHYVNKKHNSGANKTNLLSNSGWNDGWSENDGWRVNSQTGVIGYLTPGQRYWIRLTNKSGESAWYDFKVPVKEKPKTNFYVLLKAHSFGYTDSNGKWKTAGTLTPKKVEKSCYSRPSYDGNCLFLRYQLNISKLSNPESYYIFLSFILPNGDPFVVTNGYYTLRSDMKNGWLFWLCPDWDELYKRYGKIPTGTYTFICGLGQNGGDEFIIGTREFKISK